MNPASAAARPDPLASPLASVERLTITFAGQPGPAVDGVSFEVRAGECVALVGESGSGKSLTARALLGLLPERARLSGTIRVGGEDAPSGAAAEWAKLRGRSVALVPQDALGSLDPLRRIEHEVGDSLRLHGLAGGAERRELTVQALEQSGMPEPEQQLRRRSYELSGGLRQRALVAAALIAQPTLIVADEPTTALDAGHRGRVLAELRRRAEAGAGVLLISHDLVSVREVADQVLVMRRGQVVERGTPEQVFGHPSHPFTRELITASPVGKPRRAAPRAATAATITPTLALDGITASYGRGANAREVLRGASLSVAPGETVGLIGESGSGKTTLLRIALGLHAPDSGTVLVNGLDRQRLARPERRQLRRELALVPQDPLDSFPRGASGGAILADALRAAGVARARRGSATVELAEEVGLDAELLPRPAATLSGGQRQRLAIARALARRPKLLLLDEPVSALDVTVQARVLALLNRLQQRHGTAYLLVSHDLDVITQMSDRVLRLDGGSIGPQ